MKKGWTAWNVRLWVQNDEGLYRLALDCCRRRDRKEAARMMLDSLNGCGVRSTPDGAVYSVSNLEKSFVGL